MSRFSQVDLAAYPIADILDVLDFETALARDRNEFAVRWEARRATRPDLPAIDTLLLESDPASIVLEVGAYRETILGARINDRIRQLSLAGASGARLDHIGMTYYRTARLTVMPAADGQPAVLEDDESYRQRLALAPESWSTCGPEGAYLFWGASASGEVKDIAVWSGDEGCTLSPTVRVVILSTEGDGTPSAELLATVRAALSRRDRRPITDQVLVEAAVPTPFDVAITLYVRAGASHALVAAAARANVEAYLSGRRRWMGEGVTGPYWIIGRRFRVQTIAAEAMVEGVEEVDVDLPADINAPAAGYAAGLPLAWNATEPLAAGLTEHLFRAPVLGTVTITTLPAERAAMTIATSPHLLPDNATPLEQELARATATIDVIDPSAIETIWDAWACPKAMLPHLAWALSIDIWDDAWPEVTKRRAIADSPYYHRIKGTRLAVEMALDLAGRPYDIIEWFETVPPARRGTASVHIEATFTEVAEALARVRPAVAAAKPKSREILLGAGPRIAGAVALAFGLHAEETVTIVPYQMEDADIPATFHSALGLYAEEQATIGAAA